MKTSPYIRTHSLVITSALTLISLFALSAQPLSAAVQITKILDVTVGDKNETEVQTGTPEDGDSTDSTEIFEQHLSKKGIPVFLMTSATDSISYEELGVIDTFRISGAGDPLAGGPLSKLTIQSLVSGGGTPIIAGASATYTVSFDVTQAGRQANLSLGYSLNNATISWELTGTDGMASPPGINSIDSLTGTDNITQSANLDIGSYLLTIKIDLPITSRQPNTETSEAIDHVTFEVIAAVPEPSSSLLFGLGLGSMLFLRQRRNGKSFF